MSPRAFVVGEALVDIVLPLDGGRAEAPGGSPLNVAVGLSRLGVPTTLLTGLGSDERGAVVRRHVEDSGVLVTELRCGSGTVRVTDALTLRAGADLAEGTPAERGELLRYVEVLEGAVRLEVHCQPRHYSKVEQQSGGVRISLPGRPELQLHLLASRPLTDLEAVFELSAGEQMHLRLTWGRPPHRYQPVRADKVLESTVDSWRRWLACVAYDGPQRELVRRSAITLKLLDYSRSGAMVAAPTSSLPEEIGGERNWDYRYAWVRDAAFSVYALPLGLSPRALTSTSVLFFTVVNYVKLIPYFALGQFDGTNLATSALLAPVAVAFTFVGAWIIRRMRAEVFYPVTYALTDVVGVKLVWDGLTAL